MTAAAPALVWWRDLVPQHMRARPQWVAWGPDPETGRDKCPLIIGAPGRRASSTDPSTWRSFTAAAVHHERHAGPRTGIGYVFAAEGLVFVDVDHCLDERGALKPWAEPLVHPFIGGTYVERSPSGNGLHVFARAGLPGDTGRRFPVGDGAVELYTRGRYSTITADAFEVAADIGDAQREIDALLAKLAPEPPRERRPFVPVTRWQHDDAERVASALERLSPDVPYGDWVRIGMAIHSRWPTAEGLALWDAWSAGGEKYRGTRDLEFHWRSFTTGKGVALGTLFALAAGRAG